MQKLFTVGFVALAGLGAVVWAQSNAAPTTQPDGRSVEARLRAVETYLKLDAPRADSGAIDAKSLDDVKAALLRLQRQQDDLVRQVRELSQAKTREAVTDDSDAKALERDVAGLRATIRDLTDRVRRLETRL